MKSKEESVGRPQEGEQIIRINNERFTVPELLFNPSDIGIPQVTFQCIGKKGFFYRWTLCIFQMGIPECIVHVINQCEEETRRWLFQNIVLIGGCSNIPNMRERVERDVRELAPSHYPVRSRCNIPAVISSHQPRVICRFTFAYQMTSFATPGREGLHWRRTRS